MLRFALVDRFSKGVRVSAVGVYSLFGGCKCVHITNERDPRWMKGFMSKSRIEAASKPLEAIGNQQHLTRRRECKVLAM
jgi:hypothetical protein